MVAIENAFAVQLGPFLVGFWLDLDAAVLRLRFSEPLDLSSSSSTAFDATAFALQSESFSQASTETLTLSTSTSVNRVAGSHNKEVSLGLSASDLETLRLSTALSGVQRDTRESDAPIFLFLFGEYREWVWRLVCVGLKCTIGFLKSFCHDRGGVCVCFFF